MLFIIPALTMRLLSEEKKQKTYDLLLTSPITSYQITLGKFLGGYMVVLLLVVIAFLYPLGTSLVADFYWGTLISSFFGLALVTGAYVSVGLFSSSLTSSPIMSFIMTIIFILFCWFLGDGASRIDDPFWGTVLGQASLKDQFFPFIQGAYRLSAIIFFFSFISLFLFFADRIVESSRWR